MLRFRDYPIAMVEFRYNGWLGVLFWTTSSFALAGSLCSLNPSDSLSGQTLEAAVRIWFFSVFGLKTPDPKL
jgi:hypothetical protein